MENHKNKYFMKLALLQAGKVLGKTKKNPAVGCVIVKNNCLVSAGHTGINGIPHAEYNAIKFGKTKTEKSDLYVTLEPCSNYGKTPPCTKLIIKNKLRKVFFSINDPDSRSFNKSHLTFKKNGVKLSKAILNNEIKSFYRSYIKSKTKDLPFVTSKFAISKDFFSIVSWSIGLFLRAVKKDLANFSLSNCVLLPFFLITVSSLICTLSKVVNLIPPLQVQTLLLLIAVPSSVGLESTTEVSPVLQNGQSIIYY